MASGAKGKGSRIAVWVILVLLIVGLAGFGTTQFGGTINSVGQVGEREISVQRYSRELQNQMAALSAQTGQNVTIAQMQAFGLDQRVLQSLVSTVALESEADRIGLSAGDEAVREQILNISAFQGLDGSFDREAYRFTLERSGQNEAEFEEDLRAEISRTLLQGAVAGGAATTSAYVDTLFNYIGERRNFTWVNIGPGELETPIADPTDADLKAFFVANPGGFMLPETRKITYVSLTPEMLVDTVSVDETALKELYEERIADFNKPERRLVERLILGADAEAAKARIEAGEITFEALVDERELALTDIDLGDVTKAELGEAGEVVFASAELGVIVHAPTPLGNALFRVNAILAAQETAFEEARAQLAEEFALNGARRIIDGEIENIEDLLAGGATLEELANETDLQLGTIDWSSETTDGVAGYAAFRQVAAATQIGDFPEVAELDDGGLFALRVDEIIEPRLDSFENSKSHAEEGWRMAQTSDALLKQANALAEQLKSGGDFATLAVDPEDLSDITRASFVPDAPEAFLDAVFEMEIGDIQVVGGVNSAALVRLDAINGPDPDDAEMTARRERLEQSTAQSVGADMLSAYVSAVQTNAGISLNQVAINAVHAQFP